jgi:hypothetical protein
MTTNADLAAYTRLLDDLLWLHSRGGSYDGPQESVGAMIAEYTANPDHYSDGSRTGAEYIPDYAPNVIIWGPFPPPHRCTAETDTSSRATTFDRDITVDALTELIIQQGAIKFRKLADYLETFGINTAGDEELTGEHVNQRHVPAGTTLLGEVSTEYIDVVEALFNTRPVMLEIGDLACFANHEPPWWVAWAGETSAVLDDAALVSLAGESDARTEGLAGSV